MVKEACYRCKRPVYPTDKVGPLKDGAFFHHGCFKCYICGTRLSLKTYFNNRNNIDDQEIYCGNHVPVPGPHDPIPHRSNLLSSPALSPDHSSSIGGDFASSGGGGAGGVGDIRIQHALKATGKTDYRQFLQYAPYSMSIHDMLHYVGRPSLLSHTPFATV